jgi:hypothetical protein
VVSMEVPLPRGPRGRSASRDGGVDGHRAGRVRRGSDPRAAERQLGVAGPWSKGGANVVRTEIRVFFRGIVGCGVSGGHLCPEHLCPRARGRAVVLIAGERGGCNEAWSAWLASDSDGPIADDGAPELP